MFYIPGMVMYTGKAALSYLKLWLIHVLDMGNVAYKRLSNGWGSNARVVLQLRQQEDIDVAGKGLE